MSALGALLDSPLMLWLSAHIVFLSVTGAATGIFVLWWVVFWVTHRDQLHFFFDPQDDFHSGRGDRVFPKSAETATFEPMLKHYIGVTQLLVTIAAASIAFGGGSSSQVSTTPVAIAIAKLLLAWSVFYGCSFARCCCGGTMSTRRIYRATLCPGTPLSLPAAFAVRPTTLALSCGDLVWSDFRGGSQA